jgi:hypothetical protein
MRCTPSPQQLLNGMYITAPDIISKAGFINLSYHSISPHAYLLVIDRQRASKAFTAATNTDATIVTRVISYAVRVVSRKIGD